MAPSLFLLMCTTLPGQLANLDFGQRTLAGWEGEGFQAVTLPTKDAATTYGVSSQDQGAAGHTAMLHRAFVVPKNAEFLQVRAAVVRTDGAAADERIDIVLLATGKKVLSKQARQGDKWQEIIHVRTGGTVQLQEYRWPLSGYEGQTLRLALIDEDERPGRFVVAGGFRLSLADTPEIREFSKHMVRLASQHRLLPMLRYDTRHFTALSNADEAFSEMQLRNCERLHSAFFAHFRGRGFTIQEPPTKSMIALFDSQAGFEAYLGQKMPPLVTGIYHPQSNRLVAYDYGQNESFLSMQNKAERDSGKIPAHMDRKQYLETLYRQAGELRTGASVSTLMHEVAHQLSFNCGMFNRDGDKPLWLAEGLACYCEPTENGSWLGVGEPNPHRLTRLATAVREAGPFYSIKDMVTSDAWAQPKDGKQDVLLGYAQSWALFRFLLDEQPQRLRTYMKLIYARKTPEHRLADFAEVFGTDLSRLDRSYRIYVNELVQRYSPAPPAARNNNKR